MCSGKRSVFNFPLLIFKSTIQLLNKEQEFAGIFFFRNQRTQSEEALFRVRGFHSRHLGTSGIERKSTTLTVTMTHEIGIFQGFPLGISPYVIQGFLYMIRVSASTTKS
jgi:hypothetical protein